MNDTHQLFERLGLPEDLVETLYTRTQGNAELLTLILGWLTSQNVVDNLLQELPHVEEIHEFVLHKIHYNLTVSRQRVLQAIAMLLGQSGTRNILEFILDEQSVFDDLEYLKQCYLLDESVDNGIKRYTVHDLVRNFYYDMLSEQERQGMHHRAGDYYRRREQDLLKAILHYERSEAYPQMIELVKSNTWLLICQGHSRRIGQILDRLLHDYWEYIQPESLSALYHSRGMVYKTEGEFTRALEAYEFALTSTDEEAITADIWYEIGACYERQGDYQTALEIMTKSAEQYHACNNRAGVAKAAYGQGWIHYQLNDLAWISQ